MRAAALRLSMKKTGKAEHAKTARRQDLRIRVRRPEISALILFVLDVSDSMGAQKRIRDAKGSVIGLLKVAHRMRCMIGLVTVQGRNAVLTVPPTASVYVARRNMRGLRPAGGTPLSSGLRLAVRSIRNEELKRPGVQPLLLIVSDGEATVPVGRHGDPHLELIDIAGRIRRREEIDTICVDTKERSPYASGKSEMRSLSEALGAAYYHRSYLKSSRTGENTSIT